MRSSVPELILGLLASAASGFAGLGVLYCIVWVISDGDATWIARALVLAAVGAAFGAAASWLAHDGEARFAARVRRAVAAHMVRLPSSTLSRLDGERRRRLMSDDIASLHHLIAHVPAEVAVLLVIPAAAIVLLVALAGPAILLALIPGALAALMYLVVIPAMAARGNAEQADHLGRITSSADDCVRGVRTFRVYGTDAGAAAGFRSSTAAFVDSMTRRVGSVAVPAAFTVGLLQAPATLAIAFAVTYGQPLRTVAAALLLCLAVVTPALRLGHGIDYIGAGRAAGRRIDDFLALPALGSAGGAGYSLEPGDLIVKNLAVEIEGRRVLDRFDQTFRQGRLTAVLGRSGTGKSTLLRAVAGTEPNCAGTIELGGTPLDDLGLDARLRSVRMIAQVAPVVSATVRENLLVAGADDVQDSLLEDALRRAQLVVDLDRPASELSGGQAQRVGLARVFLSSAPVVLLDEPTSALDPNAARAVVVELAEYARRSGAVVVMVTHDHAVAELADATVVLGSNDATEALR